MGSATKVREVFGLVTLDLEQTQAFERPLAQSEMTPEVKRLFDGDGWKLTPATLAVKLSHGWWRPAKHLLYASTIIASAIQRGGARIIVSVPPRHGKSELLSVWTPVWFLDRWPDKYVLLTSYGADLAIGFGRRVRDTILDNKDVLNVSLNPNAMRVNSFLTTGRGGMFSVGTGGPITGRGGDLFLIDDYVKNAKDANSETIRKDTLDWFASTAYTRLEPNASIVILATRWNIKDLIGALKANPGSNKWLIIELSAIAEKDDLLGRSVGEALWPERYDKAALEGIKDTLGTYFWQSLYQQHPIPGGTNVANESWFPITDIIPHRSRLRKVRFWDLAATAGGGDYTSGTLMSEDFETGMYYIEDIRRFQKSAEKTQVAVRSMTELDNSIVADVKTIIEQEPGSAGKTVVDHYVRTVLEGFVADGRRTTGDKFVKAQPFFAAAEAGKVRLVRGPWNQPFIDEILQFPDGDFNDQVDSTAGAYTELITKRPRAGTWGREPKAGEAPPLGQLITGATW